MILIWRFGKCIKIIKLTYAIIGPFILQAWISLHTVLKSANLKSRQFKIPPTESFEQTAKYNVRLYFCLYGMIVYRALLTRFLI